MAETVQDGAGFLVPAFRLIDRVPKQGPDLLTEEMIASSNPVQLSRIFGSTFHGVQAAARTAESEAALDLWVKQHYSNAPVRVQQWAQLARDTVAPLEEQCAPPDGYDQISLQETRFYLGDIALNSARFLGDQLLKEQERRQGDAGTLEQLLRLSPYFLMPGQASRHFQRAVVELGQDLPLSTDMVLDHMRNMRTHHFDAQRRLILCPTTRADTMNLIFAKNDEASADAAEGLASVLRSHRALDPDQLAELRITTRAGASVDGITAAYTGLSAIYDGSLQWHIGDIKTLTHLGKTYEHLDALWKVHDNDLRAIFSDASISNRDNGYNDLRRTWYEIEYDLAKTKYAIRNFSRLILREYASAHPTISTHMTLNKLMARIECFALLADVDLNRNYNVELPVPSTEKTQLAYETIPPLADTGIPARVGVLRKQVPNRHMDYFWRTWEERVYQDVGRRIGCLAVAGARSVAS